MILPLDAPAAACGALLQIAAHAATKFGVVFDAPWNDHVGGNVIQSVYHAKLPNDVTLCASYRPWVVHYFVRHEGRCQLNTVLWSFEEGLREDVFNDVESAVRAWCGVR